MNSRARREVLEDLKAGTANAGLWLDRYLAYQTNVPNADDAKPEAVSTARSKLIQEVAGIGFSNCYLTISQLRADNLSNSPSGITREARFYETKGRCIVGLGQNNVVEAGITLDHTWGVPYLPGSSLKGLAAAAAHLLVDDESWHKTSRSDHGPGESFARLFGTTDQRGLVTFHDAWCQQDRRQKITKCLAHDIVTVHHPNYYQNSPKDDGFRAPDGMDSPVPIPFLTTVSDLPFLIALEVEQGNEAWLDAAWKLLDKGLSTLGIGAKTNAGYGRLVFTPREIISEDNHLIIVQLEDDETRFNRDVIQDAEKQALSSTNQTFVKEVVAKISAIRRDNTDPGFRGFINPIRKSLRDHASQLKEDAEN